MGTLLGTLHYSHSTTTYMFNQTVGLLLGGGGVGCVWGVFKSNKEMWFSDLDIGKTYMCG